MAGMRIPQNITFDQGRGVFIDGLPVIYPIADIVPRYEPIVDGPGIVWVPFYAESLTVRSDYGHPHEGPHMEASIYDALRNASYKALNTGRHTGRP